MNAKSIDRKVCILIIIGLVLIALEIAARYVISELNVIDQDVFDILFIFINLMLVLMILSCYGISKTVFYNIYVYAVVSILIIYFAYINPNDFISMFKQWDSYTYHLGAIAKLNGSEFWYEDTYIRLLALIYSCFGASYRVGVGINIIVSLIGIYFFYQTLKILKIDKRRSALITILFMLMPWKWEMALFPIREAIPTCLLSISLYYLVKWYLCFNNKFALISILLAISSMMFHSGLIFIPMIYIFFYIFYNPTQKKVVVTLKTFYNLIIIFMVVGGMCIFWWDEIFSKMPTMDFILSDEAVSGYSNSWIKDDGGSTYLTWLSYNSIGDVFLQAPLRAMYFALAPVPWEWRGVVDMVSFIVGAGIHVIIYYNLLKNRKYITNEYKILFGMLFCIFALEILLYGATTFNSGTAIRHRSKFEIILFLTFAISIKSKMTCKNTVK